MKVVQNVKTSCQTDLKINKLYKTNITFSENIYNNRLEVRKNLQYIRAIRNLKY